MSDVTLAVLVGVASALAYGVSTAVQHDVAHDAGAPLIAVLRSPRWWASIGGDTVGLVLQLAALAFGPVVLVQPLFILCLPVALPFRARFGGTRPGRVEYGWCALIIAGLAGFFLLTGDPGDGRAPSTTVAAWLAVGALVAGAAAVAATLRLPAVPRAVAVSAVSGVWFGTEAVLVNAVSRRYDEIGWRLLHRADGLVPLVGAVVVGVLGFALTQLAFRAGELGAAFPAMLIADPLTAVVLGAALLDQRIPLGPGHIVGYAAFLAVITLAAVRLATVPTPDPVRTAD